MFHVFIFLSVTIFLYNHIFFVFDIGARAYHRRNFIPGGYKFSLIVFGNGTGPIVYDVKYGSVRDDDFIEFACI